MGDTAEQRELAPGTMLDDKYQIERLLAVGGMGAVYVGQHLKLRKRVAIKVLNPQLSSGQMLERFHREAITASQIGHEGIAQVTDIGTSLAGEPFLVMELLEGEPLSNRIKATGPLAIDHACELGCQILSPLAAAHRAGVIHRDLKPDNVFLVRQSRGEMVKLLDFGISRAVGMEGEFRLTTTGLVLGTPYYMSPEQARGDTAVTQAADIYALGVILYEMLIGHVPITADNYNQLMYRVMTGEYTRPRALRPDLPAQLEDLIARAMALEPTERPPSAEAFEQQLLAFCRPNFRDHVLESSVPFARQTPVPGRSSGMGSGIRPPGTEPTVLATPQHPTAARAKKSKLPLIIAVVALAAAAVGVTIVVASKHSDEPAKTVAMTPTAPTPPQSTPTPPPTPAAPPSTIGSPNVRQPDPPPPVPPATITLRFAIEPVTAKIELDGVPVTGTEMPVPKDAAKHHLHITAHGYLPHDEEVAFDESQRLAIHLDKTAGKPTRPGKPTTPGKPGQHIETESPY